MSRCSTELYKPGSFTNRMNKDHLQLWEECLSFIKDNITPAQYDAFFSCVTSLGFSDKKLKLMVPSNFFVDQLEERFLPVLGAGIKKVYGPGVQLIYHYNIISDDERSKVDLLSTPPSKEIIKATGKPAPNPFSAKVATSFDPQLNPRYTFENYCNSESNKIATTLGASIAENPSLKTFNPLFIFGSTGVGKTHLIQAIGIRAKELNPEMRVLYVTSRLFESQYTTANRTGEINSFFSFYQSIDMLIIDDIQELRDKPKTQNTFYHIFNHLRQNNRQIILSSDRPPVDMEGFEARVLSRLKGGMSVELERPDIALRRSVLARQAARDGIVLPEDVVDFIANHITDSLRELEGIVVSLVGRAAILNCEIDMDLARKVLANTVKINPHTINFEVVTEHVSSYYGIEPDALFTKSRKREISDARQVVMYLAKKHAHMPLKAIGSRIDRSHATVIYACKNIEERLPLEKQLSEDIRAIEASMMKG